MNEIGYALFKEGVYKIVVNEEYRTGLMSLECGTDIQILWWFHQSDKVLSEIQLIEKSPYINGPDTLGVFATRSQNRPNPIGLTTARIVSVDSDNGTIVVTYFDCFNETPILDIKPYVPSFDRIEDPQVLSWTQNWPESSEKSSKYDWSQVFNNE